MRPLLSLIMIAKDSARTIGRALESFSGLVDDIVVVDTGSTDDTRGIASLLGARVFDLAWTDDFAAARNESLRQARCEWVFWLDSDEWLDGQAREELRQLREKLGQENVVYFVRHVSTREGAGGLLSLVQPRLFRNDPQVRWRYRVHEQMLDSCLRNGARCELTGIVLRHSGYDDPASQARKEQRNLRLLQLDLADHPDDPWVLTQLARVLPADRSGEALEHVSHALAVSRPGDPLRRQIQAELIRRSALRGNHRSAREALEVALLEFPSDTHLLAEAGKLAFEAGDLGRAAAAFTTLITDRPETDEFLGAVDLSLRNWQGRHNLAVVRHRQGNFAEAARLYREAIAENPVFAHAWKGLCELSLDLGDWKEFDTALARLEALAPGAPDISPDEPPLLLARARLAQEAYPEARTLLEGIVARHPDEVGPLLLLSRALLHEQVDLDEAERVLLKLLALDPGNPEAMRNLANLREYLGDEEAETASGGTLDD